LKTFIIISLSFFCFALNAQRLKSEFLISKADSILYIHVGERLYKYFTFNYNQGSFYYYDKGDRIRTGSLKQTKKTKGIFINANIRYVFNYPKIKGIKGSTFISFNNRFELVNPIELEYIPDFIKEGKPSNFITEKRASEIGLDSLNFSGIEIEGPFLGYNDKYNGYVYTINNILSKDINENGHKSGYEEIIIVDAVTSKIIYHEKLYYGLIIR
jgi:hypothetical protein